MNLPKTLRPLIEEAIAQQQLPSDFIDIADQWYWPLARHIDQGKSSQKDTRMISINGSQGSGKSTMVSFLKLILEHHFGHKTVAFSLDDFYLMRHERKQLSQNLHPLFITRGVPGTHDIELIEETLDCLYKLQPGSSCLIPRFDKASDDRIPSSGWLQVSGAVDIILFEGWCNHAPVQTDDELLNPINALEKYEDEDAQWRTAVNDYLRSYHQQVFSRADELIYLQVPSFEKVYEWRGLQEDKLRNSASSQSAVMDHDSLKRFIEHYERITRSCLAELPQTADVVLSIDEQHRITSLNIQPRSGHET